MGNPCQVVITRGKNKGSVCGQINAKCKHVSEPLICAICQVNFDRTTSYYRHINSHHEGQAKPGGNKIKVSVNVKTSPLHLQHLPQSQTFKDEDRNTIAVTNMTHVFHRLVELEEQNNALREEVEELKLKPTTTNYIAILGNDFYTELINKIGREKAMKFIAESSTKHPLSVFQKLYLDDRNPDDYPIACRDKYHFRYLDSQKRMVDDRGGSHIGTAVSKRLTDAVKHAVHDFEIEGHGNSVYGLENVQLLKKRLSQLDQDSVIKELAYITNNPNHPFFQDDVFDV